MTEESEVVRIVREYRKELNRNESAALSAVSKAWVRVESEIKNEMLELAREITERQEQGLPVYDQYIHTSKRYISLLKQTQAELDWYNNKVIDVVTGYQRDNINLGLDAANEAILQSYDVASPSWTKLNISGFENTIGMLSDGSPLNRLLKKDYPLAIEGINQALSNGIAIGKGYKQIANDMSSAAMMAYERSVLIARTEINRAYRLANTEQYRASGVVTGFRRLVYKPTACFACLMMDGDFYPVGQELWDHPAGKCTSVPETIGGNYAKWQTGKDWFMEQSAEDQRRMMGGSRYEAWKKSEVSDLKSLVYMKPNTVWGPAPAIRNLEDLGIEKVRTRSSNISAESLNIAFVDFEKQIIPQAYETAGLFTPDGKLIFKKDGDKSSISFEDFELKKMKGNILTHNHPQGSPFSKADLIMFANGELREIRAAGKYYTYSFSNPEYNVNKIYSVEKFDELFNTAVSNIYAKYDSEKIPINDFNHICLEELSRLAGLKYERIPYHE